MADTENKGQILQAGANIKAELTATTRQAQAVLLGQTVVAGISMVAGCTIAVMGASGVGVVALVIGFLCFAAVVYQWIRAQPKVSQQFRPTPATISVKRDEIVVSGDGRLVHSNPSRRLIMEALDRIVTQQPLPPPVGVVKGNAADPGALVPLSADELAQEVQAVRAKMEAHQQELAKVLEQLRQEPGLVIVPPALPPKK